MEMLRRLGTFFVLVGLVLLVLYVGSVVTKDARTNYLLAGLVTLVLGLLLQQNQEHPDSGRFNAIRRASALSRQRREERLNQKRKNSPPRL
jgi:hypothetical protein